MSTEKSIEKSTDNFTHPERIREIIAQEDPALRNLQITWSYHELTTAFRPIYGDDLVWTAFAVWASKQAGSFIRNEEIPAPLRAFLALDPRGPRPFGPWTVLLDRAELLRYLRVSVEDVSGHVADGNLLVYRRLAPLFAAFLHLARRSSKRDAEELAVFLTEIDAVYGVGEELRQAFTHYYEAIFERNGKHRAERVLAANLLVGLHEQERLQDAIKGSVSSPIRRALADPERRLGPFPAPLFLRRIFAAIGGKVLGRAIDAFEDEWERLVTRCFMTLALPEGVLDLDRDVPPLADGTAYPSALREITLPDLERIWARFDTDPDGARGSGARDWTEFGDRMAFIAELFRSRQQEQDLLHAPFGAEQVLQLRNGRMPEGDL